ncbi:MAG: hypothetical protein NTV95_00865 [Candidatus Saccharibacteria bacterium]|nr:hypothetical protein [Candidatus Saccharibacteria bacterium]
MLTVFLAVPALQRSSRNTQRTADATRLSAAISTCMGNRNGQVSSCDIINEITSNGGFEQAKASQLTTTFVTLAKPVMPPATVLNTINAGFSAKCDTAGAAVLDGTSRQAAVVFRVENGTNDGLTKCIDV